MMNADRSLKGFTLLEILLVVLIVSIMSFIGVNIINSQSIERVILNQAQQFNDDLMYVCEKAVLENQAFGFEFLATGYQVLRYQQSEWLLLETQKVPQFNEAIETELLLDGLSQDISADSSIGDENLPHIICQSDGSFNPFELRFSAEEAAEPNQLDDKIYYALTSETPWQLKGAWHQP